MGDGDNEFGGLKAYCNYNDEHSRVLVLGSGKWMNVTECQLQWKARSSVL